MTENKEQPDQNEEPENEQDVEGHSMLMYEQARMVVRERERDMQKHARDARMLEDRKTQKR
jgi:hypothetical protein